MTPRPEPSLRGKRILVVDDQALIALDLQAELEDRGAVVVGPYFGLASAMNAIVVGGGIDAAILDVDLGDGDVFPLADRLTEGGVPFVFHTGHGDLDELQARYGQVTVLLKPSRPQDVASHLRSAIAAARPHD